MAKVKRICGDMASEAQNQSVSEIEVFRHETESLVKHMLLLIMRIDSRLTSLEEKMIEASTADAECMIQARELCHDTNNMLKARTASVQEMSLCHTLVADRLPMLEEADVEVQN